MTDKAEAHEARLRDAVLQYATRFPVRPTMADLTDDLDRLLAFVRATAVYDEDDKTVAEVKYHPTNLVEVEAA